MTEPLPILEIIPELKEKLGIHNTIILQAPPGAGKSTILPLQLLHETWLNGKKILMLEPRRLAARLVASRMAGLLGEKTGDTVGYRVRFENKTSKNTRIEVLTEGILTRMIRQDNTLEGVGLVILDEFHERSLNADLALALCREIQEVLREDLRIVIMSATLDYTRLSTLLNDPPLLISKGRQYPVSYHYLGYDRDVPVYMQVSAAIRKTLAKEEGDVLVFLPGAGEIQRVKEILTEQAPTISIHPLYGDLSFHEQQEAICPHPQGRRKVVLATSIAETSLTIEGVKVVIDSGFARVSRFDPRTGFTKLETVQVTKDAADQRAGRAGRTGPGICYRLWTEGTHHHLADHRKPEIMEADLAPLVLDLMAWGVKDIAGMAWLTPPPAGAVKQALDLLIQLDAVEEGHITVRGKEMLDLPTHPRIAHLLLEGKRLGLSPLAADIAAVLEERDPLSKEAGANLALRITALRKWRDNDKVVADRFVLERIEKLSQVWRKTFEVNRETAAPAEDQVGLLLAAAYPDRIARQIDKGGFRYRLTGGRVVKISEYDPLTREEWLVAAQLDAGANEGRIYSAAPVNPADLRSMAKVRETLQWDERNGVLVARKEMCLGDIVLESTPMGNIPEQSRVNVLCHAVKTAGETLLPWTENTAQWQARVLSLRIWRPEEDWPDVSTPSLLHSTETWLAPYLILVNNRQDFQKLDLSAILSDMLPWELSQRLDVLAPEKIKVPSSSLIALEYKTDGSDPVLAVRLQEMFGLLETPVINEGRNKVLLHLLSPGYRPVQVTQDLKSFWQNTYPDVRKELRVRYQKHHWPEDPWTAEAVRGAKKRIAN